PVELTRPQGNYVVIGLAALFESTSFVIAYHKLRSANPADPILLSIHRSKNPEVFLVVFEDAAALAGLVIAFQGVFLSHQFEVPALDAIASLIIALILMVVAVFLAYESRELLLGEATGDEIISAIKKIVQDDSLVRHAERPVTMHLGPDEVLLNMDMNFVDKIDSTQVAAAVDRIEKAIQSQFPDINRIYLEAEGLKRIGG
ncbi:MAG: hypothetical protein PVI81_09250, partial [Anaerolineales bacterium]